ncbi:hypothetical protein N9R79_09645, partial [Vibrio sp.]|nr:hypothetical protein [Vibrio sp.]
VTQSSRHDKDSKTRNVIMDNQKTLSTTMAFVPLIAMTLLVGIGTMTMGIDLKFILVLAAIIAAFVAKSVGINLNQMMDAYADKIKSIFPALLILIAIGGIVGSWMFSGTVPMMIYYGLTWLNPEYVAVTAFIVTALVSLFTGTSWGSAATSGVAFMGIAQAMGLPLPLVAGAVISGAVFGDKVSPVSDTTNLSALASDLSVYEHIKGMLPNVLIAGSIAIVGFTLLGSGGIDVSASTDASEKIISDLGSIYDFNIIMLLPAFIVFYGGYRGANPLLLMISASIAAVVIGVMFNGFSIADGASSMISGFSMSMQPLDTAVLAPEIITLLSRGGFEGMISGAVLFALLASAFGSFMEVSGALDVIMKKLLKMVQSAYSLAVVTFFSSAALNGITGNGQFAIMTIGQMFSGEYRKREVDPRILSRAMENSITLLESLLPWHVSALYFAATLGVATMDYLPYALFNVFGVALFFVLAKIQTSTKTPKEVHKEVASV